MPAADRLRINTTRYRCTAHNKQGYQVECSAWGQFQNGRVSYYVYLESICSGPLLTITVNGEGIHFVWWRLQGQSSFRDSSHRDSLSSEDAETNETLIVQQTETCEQRKNCREACTN